MSQSAENTAKVLIEALPYIRRFDQSLIVIKLGGAAMEDETLFAHFAADVMLLRSIGMRPVIVHGGGPQISAFGEKLGLKPEFKDGLRVTDADTLSAARMVLGNINKDIVAAINRRAPVAVGLSGEDGGLITAAPGDADLGLVGSVARVRPGLIQLLTSQRMIPVVTVIGRDLTGEAYNINADAGAAALAAKLGAKKAIFLTSTPGLLADLEDPESTVSELSLGELQGVLDSDQALGGMRPKLEACLAAVSGGVPRAHIIDGRIPHALLIELLTDKGVGTMVAGEYVIDEA